MRWSPGFLFFALAIFAKSSSQTECPCGIAEIHFDKNGNAIYVTRVSCSADVDDSSLTYFVNQSSDEYCYGSVSYLDCDIKVHGCAPRGTKNSAYRVTLKYNEVKGIAEIFLAQNKKPNEVTFAKDKVEIAFRCIPTDDNCKNYYGRDLKLALNKDQIYGTGGSKETVSEANQKHIQKASDLLKSLTLALPPPRSMSVDANYMDFPMFGETTTTTTSKTTTTTPSTTANTTSTRAETTSPIITTASATSAAAPSSTPLPIPGNFFCECDCEAEEDKNPKEERDEYNLDTEWYCCCIIFSLWGVMVGIWVLLYRA